MAGRAATTDIGTRGAAAGTTGNGSAPAPPGGRRRPGRRRVVVLVSVVVLGAVAVATVRMGDGSPATTRPASTTTAKAERRDLVVSDSYDGQLGYGEASPVTAGRAGVVTEVAAVGTTVTANQALFSIDLQPTVLLYGDVPAFRPLDVDAADGADIRQLEQALVDLGYGAGVRVDEDFTSATAKAVKAWEEAIGRPGADGEVSPGDIAFAPGAVRVSQVAASVGARIKVDTTVVQATPTTKVVTIELSADAANRLQPGLAVGLELADATVATGKVMAIATESAGSAAPAPAGGAGGGGGNAATVAVTLSFDDPAAAGPFDSGTVEVTIERSRVDGATAVPVTALLALAEGGYAVEVVDRAAPGGSRLVPVKVGTYADDFVEVDGEGIGPGTDVVVPK